MVQASAQSNTYTWCSRMQREGSSCLSYLPKVPGRHLRYLVGTLDACGVVRLCRERDSSFDSATNVRHFGIACCEPDALKVSLASF